MAETNLFYQQLEEQCGPDYIKVIRCKDCRDYDTLQKQIEELRWKYETKTATVKVNSDV